MHRPIRQLVMLTCFLSGALTAGAGNPVDTVSCKHLLAQHQKWPGLTVNLSLPCNWVADTAYSNTVLAIIKGVDNKAAPLVGTVSFTASSIALSKEAIDLLLSEDELRAATRHSGAYISSRRISIDGNETGEVLVKAQNQVKGVTLYSYKVYNYIYASQGTLLLHFSVQSTREKSALTEFYRKLELLRWIARKSVIHWK